MKLLTHNILRSNCKGARQGYPLDIEATLVEEKECDFNPDFVRTMLDRLDWGVFLAAAGKLGVRKGLPESAAAASKADEETLRAIHHALLEVVVVEGALTCPDTGRKYPIKNGIPNMLLNEDEI